MDTSALAQEEVGVHTRPQEADLWRTAIARCYRLPEWAVRIRRSKALSVVHGDDGIVRLTVLASVSPRDLDRQGRLNLSGDIVLWVSSPEDDDCGQVAEAVWLDQGTDGRLRLRRGWIAYNGSSMCRSEDREMALVSLSKRLRLNGALRDIGI